MWLYNFKHRQSTQRDHKFHNIRYNKKSLSSPFFYLTSHLILEPCSSKREVAHDVSPYLIEYTDGSIERAGTEWVPPGLNPEAGVTSKDLIIIPETGVSARVYRPTATMTTDQKLPVVVYLHGGAFVIASPGLPYYHNFCNHLVQSAELVLVSVDYRRAPENPLPAAYDDAWAAVQWVATHAEGHGHEEWLNERVDYSRVFLAGDSAGATLAHHVACRINGSALYKRVGIEGIMLIHPYFWGKIPVGLEASDPRREMVDRWWNYVCPSDKGCDDPLINPFTDESPSIDHVGAKRMIVMVAEDCVLRERGRYYYDAITRSSWKGKAEYFVSEGKGHVFHIFEPDCEKAVELRKKLASFIAQKRD